MKKEIIIILMVVIIATFGYFMINTKKQNDLEYCLLVSGDIYNEYVMLNGGELAEDGSSFTAPGYIFDEAQVLQDKAIKQCEIIYK